MDRRRRADRVSTPAIKILGTTYNATVVGESPFDPDNAALRA
ncbi:MULTISPECIES: hypothetical protein [unclassified Rhizobium]|nr:MULTISPECIES: hypothetical protein [unclassified Rhizobium]